MTPDSVSLLGVRVHAFSVDSLHAAVLDLCTRRVHAIVANVNVHALNLACELGWLRQFFNQSHYVFCDGEGVRLGARLLGQSLPPRITYADWMWPLAEFAARNQLSLFLLGARPGVADQAAAALRAHAPGLRIAGTQHGYFDHSPLSAENQAVLARINQARPDILLVSFGMPLQEAWLRDNWGLISAGVALTGGAALDYAAGATLRGPRWMTDHGLEWLARLLIEPRRLWRRYLVGNPLFLARVLAQRLGLRRYE